MTVKGQCAGINQKTGFPCKKTEVLPDNLCIYHSPTYKNRLRQIASMGGKVRFKNMPKMPGFNINNLDDAKKYLERHLSAGAQGIIQITSRDLASLMKSYKDISRETDLKKEIRKLREETEED